MKPLAKLLLIAGCSLFLLSGVTGFLASIVDSGFEVWLFIVSVVTGVVSIGAFIGAVDSQFGDEK